MRHRVATFKIGRSGAHRRAMLANMISSLFLNGRIETTVVKAQEAGRVAEKLITVGKKGDLHHRRIAAARLRNKEAVAKLFAEIAPAYADRQGGYTRLLKRGQRRGDAAETCVLMLVDAAAKAAATDQADQKKETPQA
ncbi:MAG: 50S ribosomal protein L17 [Victivallaceae bacterium]|nr:50S ribosomal protein L17 [Victivallaceae bacterium]